MLSIQSMSFIICFFVIVPVQAGTFALGSGKGVATGHSANVCPTPVPERYSSLVPGRRVAAYFASWDRHTSGYSMQELYAVADKIDYLLYAFAVPDSKTGRAKLFDPYTDVKNFKELMALKKQFPHLKIILSIGGGVMNKEFVLLAQRYSMQDFARSCVQLMNSYEFQYTKVKTGQKEVTVYEYPGLFDGIDIDWEWTVSSIDESLVEQYAKLMMHLKGLLTQKSKISKKQYFLSSAVQVTPLIYRMLPLERIEQYVDWFTIMAYDYATSFNKTVGHNAPICGRWRINNVNGAVSDIIERVSPNKLMLGVALYGHEFENTQGLGKPFKNDTKGNTIPYFRIQELLKDDKNYKIYWDPLARTSWLYNSVDKKVISFDDQQALLEKDSFAQENRMLGLCYWTINMLRDHYHILDELRSNYINLA